jgi:hypothetical protein
MNSHCEHHDELDEQLNEQALGLQKALSGLYQQWKWQQHDEVELPQ